MVYPTGNGYSHSQHSGKDMRSKVLKRGKEKLAFFSGNGVNLVWTTECGSSWYIYDDG